MHLAQIWIRVGTLNSMVSYLRIIFVCICLKCLWPYAFRNLVPFMSWEVKLVYQLSQKNSIFAALRTWLYCPTSSLWRYYNWYKASLNSVPYAYYSYWQIIWFAWCRDELNRHKHHTTHTHTHTLSVCMCVPIYSYIYIYLYRWVDIFPPTPTKHTHTHTHSLPPVRK